MLRESYRQLLTAYVDGEVSNRQRRLVARLLHRSAEARELLQKLQEDARALRRLPSASLPIDLTGPVLRTIAERRLTPGQRRAARMASSSSWAGPVAAWAVAATVLFVLGIASYLYFAASLSSPSDSDRAGNAAEKSSAREEAKAVPPPAVEQNPSPAESDPPAPAAPDRPLTVNPPQVVQRPEEQPKNPSPSPRPIPPSNQPVLTDRLEMFRLTRVSDILPEVFKLREFEQEATRKNLIAELGKDANYRLELPCSNGTRAFQRIESAAQARNIGLVVGKGVRERLKLKLLTSYVLYLENVTPEELTHFLRQIAAEDSKRAARKPAELQFDRLVLMRMTPQTHKELSTLLGVDPTATEPSSRPAGADPRKPLSDVTAQQVGQALAGQGAARPQPGKTAARPPEHLALVLAYNPTRPSPSSEEIKQFLDSRKPARPGTLRVLIVLRG